MNQTFKLLICEPDPDALLRWAMDCRELGLGVVLSSTYQEALIQADFHSFQIALIRETESGSTLQRTLDELVSRCRIPKTNLLVMRCADEVFCGEECVATIVIDESSMKEALEGIMARLAIESELNSGAEADCDSVEALLSEWGWVSADENESDSNQPGQRRPWVLAIDDDPDFSLGLEKRLESLGVGLVRAYRGMEGFRSAYESVPMIILLDYEMPDGNGEYILRRLKESTATRDVPVIVVTGVRDLGLKRRMLAAGACEFITKPVTWQQLRDQLNQWANLEMITS